MVIIGASVSQGFTFDEPLGGPKTKELALNRYIDAALLAPHQPAVNVGNAGFFILPNEIGHYQIRQALSNNPTLVIGIDFLFWFCYGRGDTDQERLEHFDEGLQLLEAVKCPLILGDIPDASAAVNKALRPGQLAGAKARAEANRRLKEWAAKHGQVTVVPLAAFLRVVQANGSLKVHGHEFARGTTLSLLQPDRLHPNCRGCAALAITILDTFLSAHPAADDPAVRWDPDDVLRKALSPK
jgi:hypothetical protein